MSKIPKFYRVSANTINDARRPYMPDLEFSNYARQCQRF